MDTPQDEAIRQALIDIIRHFTADLDANHRQVDYLQTVSTQQVERIRELERQVADVTNERNAQCLRAS